MNIKNNLGAVLVTVGILFVLLLVATLTILDKPIDGFLGSITTILAVASGFGIIGSQVSKIGKNVNGNTTRLLNENAQLRAERNAARHAATQQGVNFIPSEPIMSEDTIGKIASDRDDLPAHKA